MGYVAGTAECVTVVTFTKYMLLIILTKCMLLMILAKCMLLMDPYQLKHLNSQTKQAVVASCKSVRSM